MDLTSIFSKLQFGFRKNLPLILQTEAAECGLACLAMIASYHGNECDLRSLRQRFSMSLKGATLADLMDIAADLGFTCRPLTLEINEIVHLQLPCIVHWNFNHFVVLEKCVGYQCCIIDPASGRKIVQSEELSRNFTGVALELFPNPQFQKKRDRPALKISQLTGRIIGLKRSLSQIFLLAISIEVCALVSPVFVQWVTDEAIVTSDRQLVVTLALGFGLIWLMQTAIEALREWIVTHMSISLNVQWLANVGNRLLRLPLPFFTKRHLGDIVMRANTVNTIQNTLSTSLVESILDGMMSVGTLSMMMLYSAKLALISLIALIIYVGLRIALYGAIRSANQSQFAFDAKQQSYLLESIRGIQSVKLFGKEQARISGWLNHVVRQKNASLRTKRMMTLFHTSNNFLFRAENLVVIVIGATAVIEKSFSIGMLLAYLAYREQFARRVTGFIDKIYEFRMLDVHLGRLADIMYEREEMQRLSFEAPDEPTVRIELKNVSFRYAEKDSYIIENLNLVIEAGQHVAIVGTSGSGKTTLLKLLAGLLEPTSGTILVNDVPLHSIGVTQYRRMVGAVMQEDFLFAGSISENICFFDEQPDHDRIASCARLAAIHDEIKQMPMGFNSLVGDMGSVLSGGQKQRVLVARALYKRPSLLLLDEATSHLDISNEKRVNEAIRTLKLTRIVIAHRPETIRSAERIVDLSQIQKKDTSISA